MLKNVADWVAKQWVLGEVSAVLVELPGCVRNFRLKSAKKIWQWHSVQLWLGGFSVLVVLIFKRPRYSSLGNSWALNAAWKSAFSWHGRLSKTNLAGNCGWVLRGSLCHVFLGLKLLAASPLKSLIYMQACRQRATWVLYGFDRMPVNSPC